MFGLYKYIIARYSLENNTVGNKSDVLIYNNSELIHSLKGPTDEVYDELISKIFRIGLMNSPVLKSATQN